MNCGSQYNYGSQYFIRDILDQIIFWTEISKEHPIVIDTLAELTNKKIPDALKREVLDFTPKFETIQKRARQLQRQMDGWTMPHMQVNVSRELCMILRDFRELDRQWIGVLEKLDDYGESDPVWQTLIQHITEEQTYAYNLMAQYSQRICY